MLRPRGQTAREAKIMASTSWPRSRPQAFGLGLALILVT